MFELGETDEPGGQHFGPEHIGLMHIGGVAEVSAGAHKPASALPPPSGHFVVHYTSQGSPAGPRFEADPHPRRYVHPARRRDA